MIYLRIITITCLFFISLTLQAQTYNFTSEPLDVVIPCVGKDLETLEMCIAGVKKNCPNVRNIYVVSDEKYTDSATWFDESAFPFSKEEVALYLFNGDALLATDYISKPGNRVGWYYQQLLKFYAAFVIPGISSNILILDSDTIILNPTNFMNSKNGGLYNFVYVPYEPYFTHGKKFTGGYMEKKFPLYSAITHHMVFQRPVLEELFHLVESHHHEEFWKAFCRCVERDFLFAGASEYEIYFNYVFSKTTQVDLCYLLWLEITDLKEVAKYKKKGYHYVTCHEHRRQNQNK